MELIRVKFTFTFERDMVDYAVERLKDKTPSEAFISAANAHGYGFLENLEATVERVESKEEE